MARDQDELRVRDLSEDQEPRPKVRKFRSFAELYEWQLKSRKEESEA